MRIQILQDIINLLRNKITQNTSFFSSDFKDRLKITIKEVVPYLYEEKMHSLEYIPNYKNKVKVDTSLIRNITRYRLALKNLKQKFDMAGLENTYNNLADEFSKEMFLKIVTYRLFDDVKLRFPIYYSNYFDSLYKIDKCINNELSHSDRSLKVHDLRPLGYDLKIEDSASEIHIQFLQEQYNYRNIVQAEEGDFIIDGGACSGDASFYFACKNKNKGKVYAFEFIDENLNRFHKNMELNPEHSKNIELIEHPIGASSDKYLYAVTQGPGSYVTDQKIDGAKKIKSIAIDDLVKEHNIEKIDFIKFDIEGSELDGLIGAKETIKKFKPKLAICIYHKTEDLWTIPKYLKEIVPEYKFYINHHSVNICESVLYAKV